MRFLSKVLAGCSARSGEASPVDEAEVPTALRNPYSSKFLDRILTKYQEPPTGHPWNGVEKSITPDMLQEIERGRGMPEAEKIQHIQRRDMRWVRRP